MATDKWWNCRTPHSSKTRLFWISRSQIIDLIHPLPQHSDDLRRGGYVEGAVPGALLLHLTWYLHTGRYGCRFYSSKIRCIDVSYRGKVRDIESTVDTDASEPYRMTNDATREIRVDYLSKVCRDAIACRFATMKNGEGSIGQFP